MGQAKNSQPFNDWIAQRDTLRLILREWALCLSATEHRVLLFVYDRTAGWGKQWEKITLDQLTHGMWAKDGACYASPVTSNRRTAQQALRALVERGVLLERTHPSSPRAKQYAINTQWEPTMKVPKRLREGAGEQPANSYESATIDGYESATIESGKSATMKKKEIFKRPKKVRDAAAQAQPQPQADAPPSRPAGSTREELLSTATDVKRRSRARRAQRMEQGRKLRSNGTGFHPTKAALDATWLHLWQEYFSEANYSPLTKVARQILWTYWRTWTEARKEGEFGDYLGWLFENWQALRVGSFAWMQDFPNTPTPNMLTSGKLRPAFEYAYRKKEEVAQWRKLTPHERELRRLVDEQGMDPERAAEVVEQRLGQADKLREVRQELKRLAYAKEELQRRQRAASKRGDKPQDKPTGLPRNSDWKDPY